MLSAIKIKINLNFFSFNKKASKKEKLTLLSESIVGELVAATFEGKKLTSEELQIVISGVVYETKRVLSERLENHEYEAMEAFKALKILSK
jgi:hypothetical protein